MANDFSGTAELARKRYELAKGMAESKREQRLGGIGATYAQRAREQEAGLESRGILSSGEASRRRMQLGAEEKALRAGAQSEAEFDINQAALDYAAVLAEIQAQQSKGLGGSGGSTTTPSIQTPTPPTPSLPPATKPAGPSDDTPKVPVPVPGSTVGLPTVRPGQGGINEIGSGGRPFGEAPVTFNTGDFVGGPDRKLGAGAVVDGIYLGPELGGFFGDKSTMPKAQPGQGGITEIGSGGREIGVAPQSAAVEPKPVGSGQIELAGVTLPATQWQKTLDALQEAQKTPALPVTRPAQGGVTEIGSAGRQIGVAPLPSVVTPAPALPVTRPAQGGVTEVGSAGRQIGVAPLPATTPAQQTSVVPVTKPAQTTVAATPAPAKPAQTTVTEIGSAGRQIGVAPLPATTPAPAKKDDTKVEIGGVTLPKTEWDAAFAALEKAVTNATAPKVESKPSLVSVSPAPAPTPVPAKTVATTPATTPAKTELVTIGDVTLPQTEWDAAFKALEKAALAKRPTVVKR